MHPCLPPSPPYPPLAHLPSSLLPPPLNTHLPLVTYPNPGTQEEHSRVKLRATDVASPSVLGQFPSYSISVPREGHAATIAAKYLLECRAQRRKGEDASCRRQLKPSLGQALRYYIPGGEEGSPFPGLDPSLAPSAWNLRFREPLYSLKSLRAPALRPFPYPSLQHSQRWSPGGFQHHREADDSQISCSYTSFLLTAI